MKTMNAKDRLIVALDVGSLEAAESLIDILSPEVETFKVGIAPFTGFGAELLNKLQSAGKKVFLDLKFHDIPNTVQNASREGAKKGIFMMNFHCLGGRAMLEAAIKGAEEGTRKGSAKPILLGVTVLTSMAEEDMLEVGLAGTPAEKVLEFAIIAKKSGMDGVVSSAKEAGGIKKTLGDDFVTVCPGVRPEWAAKGDQKRIVTPKSAIQSGADYIVVGRPIIQADDPLDAAKRIIKEMEG